MQKLTNVLQSLGLLHNKIRKSRLMYAHQNLGPGYGIVLHND